MKNLICYDFYWLLSYYIVIWYSYLLKNFMERKLLNGNNLSLLPIGYFYSNYKKQDITIE